MKMLRKLIATFFISTVMLTSYNLMAHGPEDAQYGGVVEAAHDLSFELVQEANGVAIYIMDHGEEYDAESLSGKLTVLAAGQRSEFAIRSAGLNKLVAAGVQLESGARVVLALTAADNTAMTVRFTAE